MIDQDPGVILTAHYVDRGYRKGMIKVSTSCGDVVFEDEAGVRFLYLTANGARMLAAILREKAAQADKSRRGESVTP